MARNISRRRLFKLLPVSAGLAALPSHGALFKQFSSPDDQLSIFHAASSEQLLNKVEPASKYIEGDTEFLEHDLELEVKGLKNLGGSPLPKGLGLELNVNFPLDNGESVSFTPWLVSASGQSSAANRFRHPAQGGSLSISVSSWLADRNEMGKRRNYRTSNIVFSQNSLDFATPLQEGHYFIDVSKHVANSGVYSSPLYFDRGKDELVGKEGVFLHIACSSIPRQLDTAS